MGATLMLHAIAESPEQRAARVGISVRQTGILDAIGKFFSIRQF